MRKKLGKEYAFLLDELIGEELRVQISSGRGLTGLEGRIIDESRNSFLLATSSGRKRIPKASCTFRFPRWGRAVDGGLLVGRPEDRTKRLAKELKL
ncbi:MAG TPA: ribonuclease P protein subunit [Candidatus Norongarragalinales archaeon]|nr:ribonuclease P protein subunit [Candidatus Norongarragalinales archaeon]